tara:strand:+ start:65 stop:1780 length:1716 start_codon:yes stop_codon:yes gene_type:complete
MSALQFNQAMEESTLDEIRTEIIHPIQINQNTANFNIINRGGSLDKHTQLVLPITCATPHGGDPSRQSFLPINVGIGAVIRSAQLIANGNGVVIAQNDNVGNWLALANSFQQQEFRKRVLKCRYGIFEEYEASEAGQIALGGASANAPGRIGISDMRYRNTAPPTASSSNPAYPANITGEIDSFDEPQCTNYRIRPTSALTANLYISLEALFPRMYNGLQMPIHLIQDGVSLIVQFRRNGTTPLTNERVCGSANNIQGILANNAGVQATTPLNCQVLVNEVVLLTDYLVARSDDEIAAQVMSPQGLTLQYGDLAWNNFYLPGLAATPQERNYKRDILQLGMANQVIRQMYMFFNPTQSEALACLTAPDGVAAATTNRQRAMSGYRQINGLKGIYSSRALSYLPDGEKIQVKINQQNVFNQPLEQSGHKIHELQQAYGSSFCKPQSTYEFTDIVTDSIDAARFAGSVAGLWYPQKSLLAKTASVQGWSVQNCAGSNHFIGVNLQKPLLTPSGELVRANLPGSGTRCGPTPIQIEIDRLVPKGHVNDDRNVNVCCVVEKTLNIREGIVLVIDN